MTSPGDEVADADELRHLERRRAIEDLVARAGLQHAPVVVDDDAVRQRVRLVDVVRHEERREPEPPPQRQQLAPQRRPQRRVERGERLIEQQQPRLRGERARQRDALLLAAGDRARAPVLRAFEAEQRDQLVRRAARVAARGRPSSANSMFCRTVRCGKSARSCTT